MVILFFLALVQATLKALGVSPTQLFLLVHSGSRGFGGAILDRHASLFGTSGLALGTPEAHTYMQLHDLACAWAKRNRMLIAHRFLTAMSVPLDETRCVLDIWHNNVVAKDYETGPRRAHLRYVDSNRCDP